MAAINAFPESRFSRFSNWVQRHSTSVAVATITSLAIGTIFTGIAVGSEHFNFFAGAGAASLTVGLIGVLGLCSACSRGNGLEIAPPREPLIFQDAP